MQNNFKKNFIKLAHKYLLSKLLAASIVMLTFSLLLSLYQPAPKVEQAQTILSNAQASLPEAVKPKKQVPSSREPIPSQKETLLAVAKTQIRPTPSPEAVKSPGLNSNQSSPAPSTQPDLPPGQQPQNQVNLQISEPDGSFSFSVTLKSSDNLCDNLKQARDEGKIRSLTIDDSYISSLGSSYVREINGYQNNWTVSVNGISPKGCSLYQPKAGDSVSWKYN